MSRRYLSILGLRLPACLALRLSHVTSSLGKSCVEVSCRQGWCFDHADRAAGAYFFAPPAAVSWVQSTSALWGWWSPFGGKPFIYEELLDLTSHGFDMKSLKFGVALLQRLTAGTLTETHGAYTHLPWHKLSCPHPF